MVLIAKCMFGSWMVLYPTSVTSVWWAMRSDRFHFRLPIYDCFFNNKFFSALNPNQSSCTANIFMIKDHLWRIKHKKYRNTENKTREQRHCEMRELQDHGQSCWIAPTNPTLLWQQIQLIETSLITQKSQLTRSDFYHRWWKQKAGLNPHYTLTPQQNRKAFHVHIVIITRFLPRDRLASANLSVPIISIVCYVIKCF